MYPGKLDQPVIVINLMFIITVINSYISQICLLEAQISNPTLVQTQTHLTIKSNTSMAAKKKKKTSSRIQSSSIAKFVQLHTVQ